MKLRNDAYTRIAKKYSKEKKIRTDKDVENFYINIKTLFSENEIIGIINDLTYEIYNNSENDDYVEYPNGDNYPQEGNQQLDFFEHIF
jgi:hypothetical protein